MTTLKLGTASWMEGAAERRALVAPLPSDDSRVVDLNRMERFRLAKLGEGHAETLADALVPASLRQILEGGPRALQRVRQTLAYAEKWSQRGDLPVSLALPVNSVQLLPCLPRPSILRRADGVHLDRMVMAGTGSQLEVTPQPTLAVIGWHRGSGLAGWCLALENAVGAVIGTWMAVELPKAGAIELRSGNHHRRVPLDTWSGLELPALRAAEIVILPPPRLRSIPSLISGCDFAVASPFDVLHLRLGADIPHLTLQ
jgi:hypothetical protein